MARLRSFLTQGQALKSRLSTHRENAPPVADTSGRAEQLLRDLLGRRELTEAERQLRDAELAEMTYSK